MIGTQISHYQILEKAGEGGMGVVYKAEDTRLRRTVALKFLQTDGEIDPEIQSRFVQEAQIISSLDHQNICTIFDIGETPDRRPFIVFAYYRGESLSDRLKRGALEIHEAVDIFVQICEGILQAHEKGIVHRDLKPSNIFITTEGVVKILDFGVAKLTGAKHRTKTGAALGTLPYMAPEQVQNETIDHRTDIWTLGVLLFEMLTGSLPFNSEFEEALPYQIVQKPARDPRSVRPKLSDALNAVILRALSKKPSDRYQSAFELKNDLQHLRQSDQISSQILPDKQSSTRKLPLKKVLLFVSIALTTIMASLVPLKIWRSHLLYKQDVLYIPSQKLFESQANQDVDLNIAVIVPESPELRNNAIDIAGKIHYPAILSLKSSDWQKLEMLQPYSDHLQIKHYWKNSTAMSQILDGFFDRIDDNSFWSTVAITVNAWLLYFCLVHLKRCSRLCYSAVASLPGSFPLQWLSISALWIVIPMLYQKTAHHGVLHGAFWASDFIPGIRITQIVDFLLYSVVAIFSASLLLVKIHLVRTMISAKFRHLFDQENYLRAWEYMLNSGYFAFLLITFLTFSIGYALAGFIVEWDKGGYIVMGAFFHAPFLVVNLIAWLSTRYRIEYNFAKVPLFIFWITANRKAVS